MVPVLGLVCVAFWSWKCSHHVRSLADLTAVPVRAAVAPPRLVRSSLSGLALMGHTDCANSKARRVPR